jgi:hypothetical protein
VNRPLASLRGRQVTGRERQTATSAVFVCIIVATLLLAIAQVRTSVPASTGAQAPRPRVTHAVPEESALATQRAVTRIARGFLRGYLAYLYLVLPGREVIDGTPELVRSLGEHPPRPVARALSLPRIVAVDLTSTTSGQFVANAIVNNGGIVNFTVRLLLARRGRRFLVVRVEGGR